MYEHLGRKKIKKNAWMNRYTNKFNIAIEDKTCSVMY